jgi:hypothetical protein
MTKTFTGEEFAKALCAGDLKDPLVKVGMVKKDERGSILFAPASCSDWIKVPVHWIEEVTYLGKGKCRDHEHSVAQIRFKEPDEADEGARLFAELARASSPPSGAQPSAEPGGGSPPTPSSSLARRFGGGFGGFGHGTFGTFPGCYCKRFEYDCREVMITVKGHPEIQIPTWVCEWVCAEQECTERT